MKAPPPPRSARQPQRKMFLAFLICVRPIFSEKGKDIFLWCSALQVFGQCGGAKCGTRTAREEGVGGRNPAPSSCLTKSLYFAKVTAMFEEITKIVGREEGTTSIVLAGVHGDEKCGGEALGKILPNLEIDRGTVLFGYGNPQAIEANKRYTEANLNRMFNSDDLLTTKEKESYEYRRAQFLKTYLSKAEALLDIHASSIPNSKAFAICEANAKEIVKFFPIDLVVSAFDKAEPGGTDYYMNSIEKIGICLECGYMKDPQSAKIAEESIFAFLKARGHMTNNLVPQKKTYVQMFKKYFAKTDKFTLSKSFENFEALEENQLIGIDGQEEVKTSKRSLILFAHNGTKVGDEVFLLGEEKESLV